jgi:hypothetical protein
MRTTDPVSHRPLALTVLTAALLATTPAARSAEREEIDRLRGTLSSLIERLVKSGALSRDAADDMLREAQQPSAASAAAAVPQASPKAAAPELGTDGKRIVRVPFVPESVKVQMREEIKAEVLAQTRSELANAVGVTEAGARVRIDGDLRLRAESLGLQATNSLPTAYSQGTPTLTRAPDLAAYPNLGANTTQGLQRLRLRARLGVDVRIADDVNGAIALATGSTSGPTSTNQTMATGTDKTGGFFNKTALVIDRAYLRYDAAPWLTLTGGRMRNPFMATDLVWADDLNFEGLAAQARSAGHGPGLQMFGAAGWFPLAFKVPRQSAARTLWAAQAGVQWPLGTGGDHVRTALAYYGYSGIAGIQETTNDPAAVPDYAVRSEYGAAYRQRGNTLFRLNSSNFNDTATNWGLASGFRELDLTTTVDLGWFDPARLLLTADVVANLAFDRRAIAVRTGQTVTDGSALGYLLRAQLGALQVRRTGEWNLSMAYRRLGSDAVLDAFTQSDFGQGGTNNRGFVLGGSLGVARNTWLTARWMSSDQLDNGRPATAATPDSSGKTRLSVDTLQLELNARF